MQMLKLILEDERSTWTFKSCSNEIGIKKGIEI